MKAVYKYVYSLGHTYDRTQLLILVSPDHPDIHKYRINPKWVEYSQMVIVGFP